MSDRPPFKDGKIELVRQKAEGVKATLHDNITLALQNHESVTIVEGKTDLLAKEAKKFEINAKKLKCQMCKQYAKYWIIGIAIVVIIILIIALSIYFQNKN
jgi:hypothetical protein